MVVIIAGASRSGKSTVAKRLCSLTNFSIIPFDSIITTLENLYPEIGIGHYDYNIEFSPKLAKFIAEFIEHINYEEINGIIDVYQLFPADYVKFLGETKTPIIYLGYPNLSAKEKLADVRNHQRKVDWTIDIDDEKMQEIIGQFINESKLMFEQCEMYAIPFFDTGSDFTQNKEKAVAHMLEIIQTNSD
ncbi:MAG: hypothetical protein HQ557_10315 [Bacteroidetes bacterium]|nr:hypothetical protein [Bacteroidota bacterium]